MAEVARRGRGLETGGFDTFNDRSRSRGEMIEPRGERYGRKSEVLPEKENRDHIKGDKPTAAGPDKDMHGKDTGSSQGGYRDRQGGDRHEGGGGYRDRGTGGGGRGGDSHQGGGGRGGYGAPGGSFAQGPKVASVNEGQTSMLHSNHFKFAQMRKETSDSQIYIYSIDFGLLDSSIDARINAVRSVDKELTSTYFKYIMYGKTIFSPTKIE